MIDIPKGIRWPRKPGFQFPGLAQGFEKARTLQRGSGAIGELTRANPLFGEHRKQPFFPGSTTPSGSILQKSSKTKIIHKLPLGGEVICPTMLWQLDAARYKCLQAAWSTGSDLNRQTWHEFPQFGGLVPKIRLHESGDVEYHAMQQLQWTAKRQKRPCSTGCHRLTSAPPLLQ